MTDILSLKSQTSFFTMNQDKLHLDSFIFSNDDRYDRKYNIVSIYV